VSGTDLANPQGGVDEGNQQGKTSGSRPEPPFKVAHVSPNREAGSKGEEGSPKQ